MKIATSPLTLSYRYADNSTIALRVPVDIN
jgi:hypothetical protein